MELYVPVLCLIDYSGDSISRSWTSWTGKELHNSLSPFILYILFLQMLKGLQDVSVLFKTSVCVCVFTSMFTYTILLLNSRSSILSYGVIFLQPEGRISCVVGLPMTSSFQLKTTLLHLDFGGYLLSGIRSSKPGGFLSLSSVKCHPLSYGPHHCWLSPLSLLWLFLQRCCVFLLSVALAVFSVLLFHVYFYSWLCQVSAATSPALAFLSLVQFLFWFMPMSSLTQLLIAWRNTWRQQLVIRKSFQLLWNMYFIWTSLLPTILWCHICISVYIPLKNVSD